jgi:hypothetical protein
MTTLAPPRPPQTKRGPGEPRHLVLPSGIVASGWPSVRETCSGIGIVFDEWQQSFNRALLAKTADGLYAADTALMSICRQSGKTFDIGGVVFADSIIHPGTTTVWTAHRFKVSRESFNEMRAWAKRPELAAHIDYDDITTAAGNECIPFRNGSRILFAARERGAIRGFTKVRRLILDEAQILTEAAMSDLVPTTNQAENPQIILMGTPPKPSDPGEVFSSLRLSALAGELDGVLYIEFSADEDCDIDDWDAVAQANPSFPLRTSKAAVLRLRKLLTNEDDYRREGLGIWPRGSGRSPISSQAWTRAHRDPDHKPSGSLVYALDLSPGARSASVAVSDGEHVEVVKHAPGTSWVVETCAARKTELGELIVDPAGPAGELIAPLEAAGITVRQLNTREAVQACGSLLTALTDETVLVPAHPYGDVLTQAVEGAAQRPVLDGGWLWSRKRSTVDISPLVAVTYARWAAGTTAGPSTYEDRGLVTL